MGWCRPSLDSLGGWAIVQVYKECTVPEEDSNVQEIQPRIIPKEPLAAGSGQRNRAQSSELQPLNVGHKLEGRDIVVYATTVTKFVGKTYTCL
jgi:hypothetical protein